MWPARTPPTSPCGSSATAIDYVLNGRKWWSSGALHPHCKIMIVMGKTRSGRPATSQQSHDPRAVRHPGRERSCAGCPCSATRTRRATPKSSSRRARPGRQPDRRRGRGLHDRPGAPRAGAHPSLHALDRRRRACARADVPRAADARHLRPAVRGAGQHPGLDRRVADRDRDGAPARRSRRPG